VRIPCILFSTIAMRFIVSYRHKVILTPQVLLCHINTIYLSSPPVFSGVRVTQSLVLCVCVVDRCLSFCPFSFGHCVVCLLAIVLSVFWPLCCLSFGHCVVCLSIYGFWLPL
jgi:hypothetical protein